MELACFTIYAVTLCVLGAAAAAAGLICMYSSNYLEETGQQIENSKEMVVRVSNDDFPQMPTSHVKEAR